jgi:bifunctional non-homologous end joining protein LigD
LRDIDTAQAFSIRDIDTLVERSNSRALAGWGTADQALPDV